MTYENYYYMLDMNGHLTEDITKAYYVFINNREAFRDFFDKYRFIGLQGITEDGLWIRSEKTYRFVDLSVASNVLSTYQWMHDNGDIEEFYEERERWK